MRISFYGGPGLGKSTCASQIFCDLKKLGYSIEIVTEYIKKWAYSKRVPRSFDQVYIFGQQMHAEDLIYQSGVQHLVTDSPLCLQPFYSKTYNFQAWSDLLQIGKKYEEVHPSINIFLDRTGIEYQQNGRYENAELAVERDRAMKCFLEENNIPYTVFRTLDYPDILNHVLKALGEAKT